MDELYQQIINIYKETGSVNVADFMSCHQTALMSCL